MNDAVKDLREAQARGDFDMSPAALHGLLLHRRVVVERAPRQVLQARLDERLRDKAHRTRNGATGWPWSVSDRWLQQEIDTLQGALAEGVPASAPVDKSPEARRSAVDKTDAPRKDGGGAPAFDPFALIKVAGWPKERRVGRREDMSPTGHLEVMLDGDSDVIVAVTTGSGVDDFAQASVEFCTVGVGGGGSPRTRAALIALMLAIEADNAESPRKAWPPAEGRPAVVKGDQLA